MVALCILQCAEHANQNMLGALKYAQSNHFWTEAFACTSMLITANIRYSEHAPDSHFWCKDKGSQPIGICSCEHLRVPPLTYRGTTIRCKKFTIQ